MIYLVGRRTCRASFFWIFWREFANKRPRNFGGLAVVIVDEEATAGPIFDFQAIKFCRGRNLVGLANGWVRLKDTQAVVGTRRRMHLPSLNSGRF